MRVCLASSFSFLASLALPFLSFSTALPFPFRWVLSAPTPRTGPTPAESSIPRRSSIPSLHTPIIGTEDSERVRSGASIAAWGENSPRRHCSPGRAVRGSGTVMGRYVDAGGSKIVSSTGLVVEGEDGDRRCQT